MGESSVRHAVAVLGACLLWGTTGAVAHQAPAGSDPALIGLSTFGFGGIVLFLLDARSASRALRDNRTRRWAIMGGTGVLTYGICFYQAMALAGVAVGNVIALGAGPILAAVVEFVLDRSIVSRTWAVCTAASMAGMALLATGGQDRSGGSRSAGVTLALLAALGYAVYSCMGARLIRLGVPSRPAMAAVFGVATLVEVPLILAHGLGPLAGGPGPWILGYLALGPMALAYLLFGYGLRRLPASYATTLALAEPVVATWLAVVIVGERLAVGAWFGIGLILGAVVVLSVRGGPAITPP